MQSTQGLASRQPPANRGPPQVPRQRNGTTPRASKYHRVALSVAGPFIKLSRKFHEESERPFEAWCGSMSKSALTLQEAWPRLHSIPALRATILLRGPCKPRGGGNSSRPNCIVSKFRVSGCCDSNLRETGPTCCRYQQPHSSRSSIRDTFYFLGFAFSSRLARFWTCELLLYNKADLKLSQPAGAQRPQPY